MGPDCACWSKGGKGWGRGGAEGGPGWGREGQRGGRGGKGGRGWGRGGEGCGMGGTRAGQGRGRVGHGRDKGEAGEGKRWGMGMECQAGKGGKVWQGWSKKGKRWSKEGVVKGMGGKRRG